MAQSPRSRRHRAPKGGAEFGRLALRHFGGQGLRAVKSTRPLVQFDRYAGLKQAQRVVHALIPVRVELGGSDVRRGMLRARLAVTMWRLLDE